MKKLITTMCILLLAMSSAANAARTWVDGKNGKWYVAANWGGSKPTSADTAYINNGTVLFDTTTEVGAVSMARTADSVAVLNFTTGANLTFRKEAEDQFTVAYLDTGSGTVNHSAGTVSVHNLAGNGTVLLSNSTLATGTYNLSSTGILDVDVLSKGVDRPGYFNATGGTLVVKNSITKFGLIANGYGFNQGQSILAVGGIANVGAIAVGGTGSTVTDYTVGTGGTLAIDIASLSSFDTITQYGDVCNTEGATLNVNLLGGFTPSVNSSFDIWTFGDKSKAGSGLFATIPDGFTAAWVDTNSDLSTDTLRLTYTPEPATLLLLGLGSLISLKRRRN